MGVPFGDCCVAFVRTSLGFRQSQPPLVKVSAMTSAPPCCRPMHSLAPIHSLWDYLSTVSSIHCSFETGVSKQRCTGARRRLQRQMMPWSHPGCVLCCCAVQHNRRERLLYLRSQASRRYSPSVAFRRFPLQQKPSRHTERLKHGAVGMDSTTEHPPELGIMPASFIWLSRPILLRYPIQSYVSVGPFVRCVQKQ